MAELLAVLYAILWTRPNPSLTATASFSAGMARTYAGSPSGDSFPRWLSGILTKASSWDTSAITPGCFTGSLGCGLPVACGMALPPSSGPTAASVS